MCARHSWFYDCPFDGLQRNLSGFLSGKAVHGHKPVPPRAQDALAARHPNDFYRYPKAELAARDEGVPEVRWNEV